MDQAVKLTVRLPRRLHARLKREARRSHRSLNTLIVELLSDGVPPTGDESDADAVRRMLLQGGLWAPLGREWSDLATERPDDCSPSELRKRSRGVAPLSQTIIEGRGPRGPA